MPVPFGFSVGDFLAVTELTWKVVHALRENEGAVHEVQAILETLMSFQRAIFTCQTLALEWSQLSDGEITLPERSLVNGVNHQLKLCREKLDALAKRIEQYTRSFMKQVGTRTTKEQLFKLKWMFKRDEVESLQRDLTTHIQGLETFITTLGIQVMMRSVKKFESCSAAVMSTEKKVNEIHGTLHTLQSAMPRLLGYAWEGGFGAHDKPIILMDALGRTVPIPFLFCTSPTIFHDLLELMFRGLPGYDRIMREKYNLVHQDTSALVQSTKWCHTMSPGSIILMNIVVRITASPSEFDRRRLKVICPRCNEELPRSNASLRCRRCYRDFGFSESERVVELAPQPVRLPAGIRNIISAGGKTASRTDMTTFRREADRAAELAQFQRVHFIRELLQPSWDSSRHGFNKCSRSGLTPNSVHLAVGSGSLSEMERVLEEHVDLEARDCVVPGDGWTPLQLAVSHGEYSMVDLLIRAGANVNAPAPYGSYTAIQAAARSGNLAIVERLLQAGAHINAPAPEERSTAIQAAARSGNLAVVERLLQAGADVNASSSQPWHTAIQAAVLSGNLAIIERVIQAGADVNAPKPGSNYTALRTAASLGNVAIVERLLQAGADVDGPAPGKVSTALQTGAALGGLAIVERLLQAGADVNTPAAGRGYTALQAGAAMGALAVVERLLYAGANVNAAASKIGSTAIQAVVKSDNIAIVERLLQAGADVNAPAAPIEGHTAIQAAAAFGNLATIERLLQAGANFNAPATIRGSTAIQAAVRSGNLTIVERLLEAGADVNAPAANCEGYAATAIQNAAYSGNVAITERLLQAGANVNDRGSCNISPLEIAEKRGNVKMINLLVRFGAKPTAGSD